MEFKLEAEYSPMGDQPKAIDGISKALSTKENHAVLWGVTGSGKTFTMANIIQKLNKPTLILSHNKTLAAQLYSEFKAYFPNNAVEYFVSYYDYYQPEAYLPATDTYIEKDLSINEEIEKLRLRASSTLLSGRKDTIVISTVSCLYGIGNPDDFHANTVDVKVGTRMDRNQFLLRLTDGLYSRNDIEPKRGTFKVQGESVFVYVGYDDIGYRIIFFDDEIERIDVIEPLTNKPIETISEVKIHPASIFVTTRERINNAINLIQDDMVKQCEVFEKNDQHAYSSRLKHRVEYDLEMIKEVGYCSGIENYSLYFDGRQAGSRPFCLMDYFGDDFLLIVDESHVTLPQVKAMYGGDASRKNNLVEFGFRLPTARDNRPLTFKEFEGLVSKALYVSATPAEYELKLGEKATYRQYIRPTGLVDPVITVVPKENQTDRVAEEIQKCLFADERVMITTVTKRLAEELQKYLENNSVRCRYIHSDVENRDRMELIEEFRNGLYDVLIGVNLLREGLDIPQVALVIIMDADKEGFLRDARSLTQTSGRAARNVNGRVIMFADRVTKSMQKTMDESEERRKIQLEHNEKHNIIPRQIIRETKPTPLADLEPQQQWEQPKSKRYDLDYKISTVANEGEVYGQTKEQKLEAIEDLRKKMESAAKELDFSSATVYRDRMILLQKSMEK